MIFSLILLAKECEEITVRDFITKVLSAYGIIDVESLPTTTKGALMKELSKIWGTSERTTYRKVQAIERDFQERGREDYF